MADPSQFISPQQAKPPFFVGIDLGGTNIKAGVVDDQGSSLCHLSIPTEVGKGPEHGARRAADAVLKAIGVAKLTTADIAQVGLGTPGTMDLAAGMLLEPANLPGWWHFPIRQRVSQYCGLPVAYANDANAAAYGEFWVGSGKVFHSLALFTLGTGVGGGIIIGDLSIDGENSAGSELGHTIIDYNDNARVCSCGQRGHLEAYASASSVIKRTLEALAGGRASTLSKRLADGEQLTPLVLAAEAQQGDELSLQIVMETARYLGIGAVNIMHTVDPSGVVFGGAMTFGQHETELGRQFLARIQEEVHRRAFPMLAQRTTIDYAALGSDAGYIGAAGIARLEYRRQQAAST